MDDDENELGLTDEDIEDDDLRALDGPLIGTWARMMKEPNA